MNNHCQIISENSLKDGLDIHLADSPASPLLLSFPHSGDVYPDDFGYDPSLSYSQIDFPSDKYVDELFGEGRNLGLGTIKANFPRAYVDVNRHQHDIDAQMLENSENWYGRMQPTTLKAGATLFWSESHGKAIYARKLSLKEAKTRIARYFIPYHQSMTAMIERVREVHGAAYIVDCHSMTRFDPARRGGKERPQIDIGTRSDETCAIEVADKLAECFEARGYEVGRNKRFAGGEITLRYGWPEIQQHILQVELRRDLYMDESTRERGPKFEQVQQDCAEVLREFKYYVDDHAKQSQRASS